MKESVREHLPVIVVVTLVGIGTAALLLSQVLANVGSLDAGAFSSAVFAIPCLTMFICATVITLTAHSIGRQLYLVVVVICLATGLVCIVVTSSWMSDPSISGALLANSPDGTILTPILQSPITMLRDIAAAFVAPTVGCILGAWLGSRLHPMTAERGKRRKRR